MYIVYIFKKLFCGNVNDFICYKYFVKLNEFYWLFKKSFLLNFIVSFLFVSEMLVYVQFPIYKYWRLFE